MAELKRTFTGGKMDKDTDERIVQNGLYREALNISVATSEDSDVGAAQNILGNIKVTEAIQSRTYNTLDEPGLEYIGGTDNDNYHIATIVDPQTSMLYRFVHTASPIIRKDGTTGQGIWMDRIIEFDTSKNLNDSWYEKEHPVFVDIFKVSSKASTPASICAGGNLSKMTVNTNIDQIRWGMLATFETGETAIVENVNYTSGEVILDKVITAGEDGSSVSVVFTGDRNLNFGAFENLNSKGFKTITGINIIDGMIFWTDNDSEPKKVNIKRSKAGSSGTFDNNFGREISAIDNFNQHTLLVVDDKVPEDSYINENSCTTYGCMDPLAFNYDPTATDDNREFVECILAIYGCTDLDASNYDALANTDDGSCCSILGCMDDRYCEYDELHCADTYNECRTKFGCTDEDAENYDPLAGCDDGSCIVTLDWGYQCVDSELLGCMDLSNKGGGDYKSELLCESALNNDTNSCCDPERIVGCTDPVAVNHDASATCDIDNECTYDTILGCTDPSASNYNALANTDDGLCIAVVNGCTDTVATNHDPSATVDDGSCTYVSGCTDPIATNYNPLATQDDGSCNAYSLGCTDLTASNYDASATIDDGSCDYLGCTDATACNFDANANIDDGSCNTLYGCMDPLYVNYDSTATCPATTQNIGTGLCSVAISTVTGCTSSSAFNEGVWDYDCTDHLGSVNGTAADASGVYTCCEPVINGCTDSTFTNFDASANTDDGSCANCSILNYDVQIPQLQPFKLNGGVTPGTPGQDDNYIHDFFGPSPDTTSRAANSGLNLNRWSGILWDGGWPDGQYTLSTLNDTTGCSGTATINIISGCMTSGQYNYDPLANITYAGACIAVVDGCTDPTAFNYDALANTNDGSCIAVELGCTDPTAFNYAVTANTDGGSCFYLVDGCTNIIALNYDALATNDDGSCVYENPILLNDMPQTGAPTDGLLNSGGLHLKANIFMGSINSSRGLWYTPVGASVGGLGFEVEGTDTHWVSYHLNNLVSGGDGSIVENQGQAYIAGGAQYVGWDVSWKKNGLEIPSFYNETDASGNVVQHTNNYPWFLGSINHTNQSGTGSGSSTQQGLEFGWSAVDGCNPTFENNYCMNDDDEIEINITDSDGREATFGWVAKLGCPVYKGQRFLEEVDKNIPGGYVWGEFWGHIDTNQNTGNDAPPSPGYNVYAKDYSVDANYPKAFVVEYDGTTGEHPEGVCQCEWYEDPGTWQVPVTPHGCTV